MRPLKLVQTLNRKRRKRREGREREITPSHMNGLEELHREREKKMGGKDPKTPDTVLITVLKDIWKKKERKNNN